MTRRRDARCSRPATRTGSRHLDAGRAAAMRAWVSLVLYAAAGYALGLEGDAAAYYAVGLAIVGMWAAGGESLVAALSTLRHLGEGLRGVRSPATGYDGRPTDPMSGQLD